jgi:hypothetical protein
MMSRTARVRREVFGDIQIYYERYLKNVLSFALAIWETVFGVVSDRSRQHDDTKWARREA